MSATSDLARRIADCLEQRLPDYGFEPRRYPSGENKSVEYLGEGTLVLTDASGMGWLVEARPLYDRAPEEPT